MVRYGWLTFELCDAEWVSRGGKRDVRTWQYAWWASAVTIGQDSVGFLLLVEATCYDGPISFSCSVPLYHVLVALYCLFIHTRHPPC